MDGTDRARVRADLLAALDWPTTTGEVEAAAEQAVTPEWRDEVVVAASRLPDRGRWLDIDELWDDLDPILEDVVHG